MVNICFRNASKIASKNYLIFYLSSTVVLKVNRSKAQKTCLSILFISLESTPVVHLQRKKLHLIAARDNCKFIGTIFYVRVAASDVSI